MRSSILWLIGGFLSVFSLVVLKSISPDLVDKQFWFFCGGWFSCFLLTQLPESLYRRSVFWIYVVLTIVLLGLLFFGDRTRGTTGWFEVGYGLKIQPSQFAVPIVMAYLVQIFSTGIKLVGKKLLLVAVIAILPGVLIFLEPDFGTGVVYFLSIFGMLLLYGIPRKVVLSAAGALVIGVVFVWLFIFKQYQKDRILGFLNPSTQWQVSEETSTQYNARQSLIAVGSGGLWGKGLGQGVQSHLRFLPERQTDFIFASLAEETGFIGTLTVVLAYASLITWLIDKQYQLQTGGKFMLLGTSIYFFVQTGINIGMNIGLLPITGITLPLLSYGGSSILATCVTFGLIHRQIAVESSKISVKIV